MEQIADCVWIARANLGAGDVCLYIVRGEQLALIDTGYSNHPAEVLEPALAELGLRLADVDLILNTHGHADHLGGNAYVKNASGALAHLHEADVPMSHGPEALLESRNEILWALRLLGWNEEADTRANILRAKVGPDAGVDRVLRDGDTIDLGKGIVFRVIHTPGHTPGSITYFSEADGLAFVGDAVRGWGGPPGGLPYYLDPVAYEKTLKLFRTLPIQTMCMGHPSRWSGEAGLGGPVRHGDAVKRTLIDSQQFIPVITAAVERFAVEPDLSLEERVRCIIASLPEPFVIQPSPKGRYPGFAAATVLGYLGS